MLALNKEFELSNLVLFKRFLVQVGRTWVLNLTTA
jgi:hypothetical protein